MFYNKALTCNDDPLSILVAYIEQSVIQSIVCRNSSKMGEKLTTCKYSVKGQHYLRPSRVFGHQYIFLDQEIRSQLGKLKWYLSIPDGLIHTKKKAIQRKAMQ